jgi:hypothetical protein
MRRRRLCWQLSHCSSCSGGTSRSKCGLCLSACTGSHSCSLFLSGTDQAPPPCTPQVRLTFKPELQQLWVGSAASTQVGACRLRGRMLLGPLRAATAAANAHATPHCPCSRCECLA